MAKTVSIGQLADAISEELEMYSKNILAAVRKETDKAMRQLVQDTKQTAPVGRRRKHYRDSIASRTTENDPRHYEKQWYVKGSDYRLSHLLNNGHALRNGGRYEGTQFITKASVSVIEDYEKAVREAIRNAR